MGSSETALALSLWEMMNDCLYITCFYLFIFLNLSFRCLLNSLSWLMTILAFTLLRLSHWGEEQANSWVVLSFWLTSAYCRNVVPSFLRKVLLKNKKQTIKNSAPVLAKVLCMYMCVGMHICLYLYFKCTLQIFVRIQILLKDAYGELLHFFLCL